MSRPTIVGVRHIQGNTWEIDYSINNSRKQHRIEANSKQEAFQKRSEQITAALKCPTPAESRDGLTFDVIWPAVERGIIADQLVPKTFGGLKRTYDRIFTEFRLKKFPNVITPQQLTSPFFAEYKNYYIVELNHAKGGRAEMQRVKCIMHRLHNLKFCSTDLMDDLKAIKTPPRTKLSHPDITNTNFKLYLARIKKERPRLFGPCLLMSRTGRRVRETTLIERADVVWDDKLCPQRLNIRAETTKKNTNAPLEYLPPDLQGVIRQAYQDSKRHKAPNLFLNELNKKIDPKMITRYLGNLSEEMFKVRLTTKFFRHRFLTQAMKAGVSLIDIQAVSGLRDVKILLQHYAHSSPEGAKAVFAGTDYSN